MITKQSFIAAALSLSIMLPSFAFACADASIPGGDLLQPGTRAWGPEQATGAPNTEGSGDIVTAWASLTPDEHDEWLLLTYRHAVSPASIHVYETFNTGALAKVTVFQGNKEVTVWEGSDPVSTSAGHGVAEIPADVSFKTRRVKLYFHSKAVPGWNEIDAVGVEDKAGAMHWAVRARASSTYANLNPTY